MEQEPNQIPDIWPTKLKEIREQHGDSLKDLERKTGISYQRIQRAECGKNACSLETIAHYARQYRLPLSHFIKDDDIFSDVDSRPRLEKHEAALIENLRILGREEAQKISEFVHFMALMSASGSVMGAIATATPDERTAYLKLLEQAVAVMNARK